MSERPTTIHDVFEVGLGSLSLFLTMNVLYAEVSGTADLTVLDEGLSLLYVAARDVGISQKETSLVLLGIPISVCIYYISRYRINRKWASKSALKL